MTTCVRKVRKEALMFKRLQYLGQGQRIVVFVTLMIGGLLLLAAVTVFLILLSINNAGRVTATVLQPGINVREFVILPDSDAYPAAVAVAPNGTVYTGSYSTGTVWAIQPDGTLSEIPGTRDQIASITGLAVAADGTLYLLDRESNDPRAAGGVIWRLGTNGTLAQYADITDETGFLSPHALTVDAAGRLYATDRGRRAVLRWQADGTGGEQWWTPDEAGVIPTGIAYDALHNAIMVTDSELNTVYRIPVEGGASTIIYRYTSAATKPSFDGITVAPDGTLYLGALEQNAVATLRGDELVYLVGTFRNPADLEIAPDGSLYVTNFDSSSLVVPGVQPHLPFALDVVTFGEIAATP